MCGKCEKHAQKQTRHKAELTQSVKQPRQGTDIYGCAIQPDT